jgi:hypothetical protein
MEYKASFIRKYIVQFVYNIFAKFCQFDDSMNSYIASNKLLLGKIERSILTPPSCPESDQQLLDLRPI